MGSAIEHVLLTDSSSAQQLICRQGTGKIKHVAGNPMDPRRCEMWTGLLVSSVNRFDCGPFGKTADAALASQGLCSCGTWSCTCGAEEFQQQFTKHGESRQLSKLAKAVAPVILVLGLEPIAVTGVEISGDGLQCDAGDEIRQADSENFWIYILGWFHWW